MTTGQEGKKPWELVPRRGWGKRPAIVVVDMSRGFTDPKIVGREVPMHRRAVKNIARVLTLARELGIPTIHTVIAFHESLADMGEFRRPDTKVGVGLAKNILGSEAVQVDEALRDPRDMVFYKKMPSGFFGTPLAGTLKGLGVDTVVVTGCNTCGCIRGTTIDSFSYGFRTIVPEDCVADGDATAHYQALVDTSRRYCDVITADEVLATLPELEGALAPRKLEGALAPRR